MFSTMTSLDLGAPNHSLYFSTAVSSTLSSKPVNFSWVGSSGENSS